MTNDNTINDSKDTPTTGSRDESGHWRIILNPASGTGDHAEYVHARAADRGYTVRETDEAGDAIALAKDAATDDVQLLAACGGDGTIHQVVSGLDQADALADTTVAVIPAGTGNNFAQNIGVTSIEQAFDLLETGKRRRIDLGMADGEPFTNSCIAGLTAQTSSETDSDLKERFGTLAYVITGFRQATEFDPLHVEIDTATASPASAESTWTGEALCILIGNARQFPSGGQANVEDGFFNITIVEAMPTNELLTEAAIQRFFGEDTEHVTHFTSEHLEITTQQGRPVEFSLDGEMSTHQKLSLHVRPRAVDLVVGPEYTPESAE